ncbi:MAG: hypothetical protein KJ061_04995 [Vicinamibacteraceae bacterium]|nr:hypothetical protein [Vicinamibacteraceae bacterium]
MTPARLHTVARVLVVAGVAGAVAGLVHDPARTWAGILIASFGTLAAGLGGLFFVALNRVCGATWDLAFRGVPATFAAAIPVGAAGLALVFVFAPWLYPWMAEAGHLTGFKAVWLSQGFFYVRAAVYVALWLVFAAVLVGRTRQIAIDPSSDDARATRAPATAFLIVFALTFWLASVDWIMSLEPHWYSTIFGVYHFAGAFASTLALLVLALMWLRRQGLASHTITDAHFHDLGTLLFAFSTFWMYIWFSQYMLMWYSNIPEEATYYVRRREGAWLTLFYLNVGLNWVVPFLVLLFRRAKRGRVLAAVAAIVVAGRALDLYTMIWPAIVAGGPRVGLCELGPLAAAAGLFLLALLGWGPRRHAATVEAAASRAAT